MTEHESGTVASADPQADRQSDQDSRRCRLVEDALYRRARGYKISLKKTYKVKRVEFDPDTGKKVLEQEELKTGVDETHIPADVRVCAYYLNNRDPARWQEHPKEEDETLIDGAVDFPPLASLPPSTDGEDAREDADMDAPEGPFDGRGI